MARGFDFVCVLLSEIHLHTAKRHARGHCLASTSAGRGQMRANAHGMTGHVPRRKPGPVVLAPFSTLGLKALLPLYPRLEVARCRRFQRVPVAPCIPYCRAAKLEA